MGCSDYFAVKTDDGYVLLEWFSGYHPDKGDKVTGEFGKFGYQVVTTKPDGTKLQAYIADYGLSLDDANDKLKAKCK